MSHWVPIAHQSELAKPGDFVTLPWRADGEIAITNIGGEVVAFSNRCHHRGARIFDTMSGNREPRCAYHGRLVTPSNTEQFKAMTAGGFVFALDEASPVEGDLLPLLSDFVRGIPPLTLHSTLSFPMDCDWRVAVENTLDFEHIEPVHSESLARLALVPKALDCYSDGSSIETFVSESQRLGRLSRFFPHERRFDYVHAHFAPHSCLSSTRGWTYSLQHYFPRADGRTQFIHRLYATETTRPMPEFFDGVHRLNAQVFAEDDAICARVPAGFVGHLGPRDARIAHFRSHC